MKFIDLHCDTLTNMMKEGKELSLFNNKFSVDFTKMKKGECTAQFFAVYMWKKENIEKVFGKNFSDDDFIERHINKLSSDIAKHNDIIGFAKNFKEMTDNEKNGKMSAFLTIEDGRAVDGKLDKIKKYYDLGVRLITLTWNYVNSLGHPNNMKDNTPVAEGLTRFGVEAVEYMNKLGILVDVSHLSDGGFWDVVKYSTKPFVASHSNARKLSPIMRNLTDEMLIALAEKGGVTGLNFCASFLTEDIHSNIQKIDDIVKQAMYIKNKAGIDVLALGSDFDGIGGTLELDRTDRMPALFEALKKAGFTESELDKLTYKNSARVIQESMK